MILREVGQGFGVLEIHESSNMKFLDPRFCVDRKTRVFPGEKTCWGSQYHPGQGLDYWLCDPTTYYTGRPGLQVSWQINIFSVFDVIFYSYDCGTGKEKVLMFRVRFFAFCSSDSTLVEEGRFKSLL